MAVWNIVNFSSVSESLRFDAEHYQPAYLENIAFLQGGCAWPVVPLRNKLLSISGGATPSGADYPIDGIPFLRVQNIMSGYLEVSNVEFISEHTHLKELARSRVQPGDVLLTITGMSYGKATHVTAELGEANINQHSVRMAFQSDLLPEYVATYLNCRYGKLQSDMLVTGITRPALNYEDIRGMLIPLLPLDKQVQIKQLVYDAESARKLASTSYAEAEALLLHALQLDKLAPAAKTYTAPFSDFTRTLRLDAQYYQPRYRQTLARLGQNGLTVGSVAQPVRSRFRPVPGTTFQYLEIGGLLDGGRVEPEPVAAEDAPSRAQTVLQAGDVVTSSVRPIRRLTGFIGPAQGGTVGTSGFIALRPTAVAPEVLTVYLRLPIVCEILDLYTTATMYPTVTEADVLGLPFPALSAAVQADSVRLVQAGFAARQRATELLDEAKRRVEEFIQTA